MNDKKLNEKSIVENMSGSIPAPEDVDYDELLTQALDQKKKGENPNLNFKALSQDFSK